MNAKKVTRYQCKRCARVWREEESADRCCRCRYGNPVCGKPIDKIGGGACIEHAAISTVRSLRRGRAFVVEQLARIDARIAEEKARIPKATRARS